MAERTAQTTSKQIAPFQLKKNRRVLKLIRENVLLFSTIVASIVALLGFAVWLFNAGKALAFNIPIEEVPDASSLHIIVLLISFALIVFGTNIWSYNRFVRVTGFWESLFAIVKIIGISLIGYISLCCVFTIATSITLQTGLNLSSIEKMMPSLLILFALLFLTLFYFGIVLGIAKKLDDKPSKNQAIQSSADNDDNTAEANLRDDNSPSKPKQNENTLARFTAVIFAGIVLLGAIIFSWGSATALQGDTIMHGTSLDGETEYALILSTADSFCAERVVEASDGAWAVDTTSFRWIARENLILDANHKASRPTYLFPESVSLFSSNSIDYKR